MALVQKSDTRRSLILAGVFVVLLIAGAVVLFVSKKSSESGQSQSTFQYNDLPIISTFGEDLFETDQFKSLKDYTSPQSIVPSSNTNAGSGNPNPFRSL